MTRLAALLCCPPRNTDPASACLRRPSAYGGTFLLASRGVAQRAAEQSVPATTALPHRSPPGVTTFSSSQTVSLGVAVVTVRRRGQAAPAEDTVRIPTRLSPVKPWR